MAPAVDPRRGAPARPEGRGLPVLAADGRPAQPGVRRQGRGRAHDGRRRTSAAPPRRPTGCSRRRSRRSTRAACRRARRSAAPCSSCAAPSRTSTPRAPRAPRSSSVFLPFGDRLTDYFRKYQSAQSHLDAILHGALRRPGRAAPRQRRAQPGEAEPLGGDGPAQPVRLRRRAARRPARGEDRRARGDRPERAKSLREDVLFYVRQKHQDLLTQLAVSIQNYLAIDIVIKNNIELVKGVDRATTTTVSALRTAVIVAQALNNQKLVLDQITALNTTTSNMIQSTSEMLRDNSVADPAAGRERDDRAAAAAVRVPEHLRDDGRHRHVQGAGPGQHGRDDRHAGERGHQVPRVPRPGQPHDERVAGGSLDLGRG